MKRRLCTTLAIMVFSVMLGYLPSNHAYAMECIINENVEDTSIQTYQYLSEALALEFTSENSPLGIHDFSEISIGGVLEYYIIDQDVVKLDNTYYIPVFCEGELLSIAHVVYDEMELVGVELTDDLVDELSAYIGTNIALIAYEDTTYIFDGSTTDVLKSYQNEFSADLTVTDVSNSNLNGKVTCTGNKISYIENELNTISIDQKMLTAEISLDALISYYGMENYTSTENEASVTSSTYSPSTSSLNMKIFAQGTNTCWAAAVASIGYELTGTSRTASYVSNYIYGSTDHSGTTYYALFALQEIYGLDGTNLEYAPAFSIIRYEIYTDKQPIYVRVYNGKLATSDDYLNHALFIDGYYAYSSGSYTGCLYVGDSNFTTSHQSIYFTTDQKYPYTLNGETGYVDQHIRLA